MKLLLTTQRVDLNDPNLGFFHRWIEEFAKNTKHVFVIAQSVGEYHMPSNVLVYSLGKEKGYSKWRQLFNFYRYFFHIIKDVDGVFVHMIPLWLVLGYPVGRIFNKKFYLWYTHKSVTPMLRIAEKFSEKIFTASDQSLRLLSKKIEIVGHGIDTDKFNVRHSVSGIQHAHSPYTIITAGRISASKNIDMFIEVGKILKINMFDFKIKIAGAPITVADKKYFQQIKNLIITHHLEQHIEYVGAIPYQGIEKFYQEGDLFVNLSSTGSIDKAVLEAMACGLNILTSNEAFFSLLPEANVIRRMDHMYIAERIMNLCAQQSPKHDLREIVLRKHNLKTLVIRLIESLSKAD